MDTLRSMRVFRQVTETGSFTAAAIRMDMSLAMASKHVAHLERELRARLLNRSSRHVSLTEAGALYYAHCRDALDTLDGAAAALSDGHLEPRGLLRITAPVWCATGRFADLLAGYRERHPDVLLELSLTNEKIDLAQGGFDLALRVTNEPSPALIVRPVVDIRFRSVASPACLARFAARRSLPSSVPTTPAEASGLEAILPSYLPGMTELPVSDDTGTHGIRVRTVMRSDDTTLNWHAARAGIGAAFLPEWLIDEDLAGGRLQPVLPGWPNPVLVRLYAAYTSRRYMTPKVRSFIDFMLERLGS